MNLTARDQSLLRETSVAKILAVEVSTLRRWRWAGTGPKFIKIGAAVRYDRNDIAEFIQAGRRQSTTSEMAGASNEVR